MPSPVFYRTTRREPPAGPMITPGEHSRLDYQDQTPPFVSSRMRQSEVHCRPSRSQITFFLAPGNSGGPAWSAEDFIMGHESVPHSRNTPRGRLSIVDDRRNIDVPPRIAYGSLVGDFDGVSPNGLD
jgi:hypothetical protein